VSARAEPARSQEREWWLRLPLVLQAPRAVFAALRDDSDEAVAARAEPLLSVIFLAGIAAVLSTNLVAHLLDDWQNDAVILACLVVIGGLLYGVVGYFFLGALLSLGLEFAGSAGSYRRDRHLLAFAAVPLALSLAVWPVRLALYGQDSFKSGGSDSGIGGSVFEGIELAFLGWSAALLVLGVRTAEGWTWLRALAGSSLVLAIPALALLRAYGAF
jgi:hypothetical protein